MGVTQYMAQIFPSGRSTGLGILLILGFVDYFWAEYVFECPCTDHISERRWYSMTFVIVPCLVLIFVDTKWKLLFVTASCGKSMKLCCKILSRTVLLSAVWITFSMLEKKFSACFFVVEPCECKNNTTNCSPLERERASKWRVLVAKSVLAVTIGLAFVAFVVAFCIFKAPCCRSCLDRVSHCDCTCSCIDSAEAQQQQEAIITLLSIQPKLCKSTIFTLEEQGVLETVYEMISSKTKHQQMTNRYNDKFFVTNEKTRPEKLPLLPLPEKLPLLPLPEKQPLLPLPEKEARGGNLEVRTISRDGVLKLRDLMTAGEFEKLKAILEVTDEPSSITRVAYKSAPQYSTLRL